MSASTTNSNTQRGFTVVELLVVVAIIVALLSTLIVALRAAALRATGANTQVLMSSISQGITQFQNDVGYMPPVLGRAPTTPSTGIGLGRDFLAPPRWLHNGLGKPTAQSRDALQDWYSITSVAEYLLGYGDRFADGYGAMGTLPAAPGSAGAKETPLLGFRSPGPDGVWHAVDNPSGASPALASGRYFFRNVGGFASGNSAAGNAAVLTGKVYGPYLELKDDSLLGALTGYDANGEPQIARVGEAGFTENAAKVVLDYWGNPIQYYRRAHSVAGSAPGGNVYWSSINSVDLKLNETNISTPDDKFGGRDLGDIIAMRPLVFQPGEDGLGIEDLDKDRSTLMRMKGANFALMSRGADKSWDKSRRRSEDLPNRDNLVEIGQ